MVAAGLLVGCACGAVGGGFTEAELAPEAFDAACEARMAAWKDYITNYRPDYSDSSAYLLPPADHRLKKPFAIVKDGKPACEIFMSGEGPQPCIGKAVEEFVGYVKDITGVEIPVSCNMWRATQKTGLNKLMVGKRALLRSKEDYMYAAPCFEPALLKLKGRDGYAIMTDGVNEDRLYVFGTMDKGTMNGLYALLENNTDIIWARPDEAIGTVYTQTPGELTFVWGEGVVNVPDTPGRGWGGNADRAWMAHNGCNIYNSGGGGDITYMNVGKKEYGVLYTRFMGGHNIGQFLRGETRWRNVSQGNPCFTGEDAFACLSSNLLAAACMAPEDTDRIYLNLHDTWTLCTCESCRKPIVLPDGTTVDPSDDAFRSTQYWLLMNRLGRVLAKEFPRMGIVSLAYFSTAAAPKCDLEPNVYPEFAPYVRVNDKAPIFAKENRFWIRRLADWSKRAPEVETYEYNGLGLGFPRPLAEVRAWDHQVMDPFIVGICPEYSANGDDPAKSGSRAMWDASAIELWVATRLYWDPNQDVEKLRKRFIRRAYREAAPEIERVYGIIREEWFKSPRTSTLGDAPVELAKAMLVKTGRDKEIEALFAKALARTQLHEKSRKLVEALQKQLMAQIEEARNLKNPMLTVPLVRPEGKVGFDSAVWEKAAETEPFVKPTKKRDEPSAHPTRARVFHDSDNLWVKVVCEDAKIAELPVHKMRAPSGEEVPEADHVELFLCDPLEDGAYYLFSMTPEKVTADLKCYDEAWNGEWERDGRRTATGWEVWFKIPLKTIHADNDKGNDLRMLITRDYIPHGGAPYENSSWGGGAPHFTAAFGDVKLMR